MELGGHNTYIAEELGGHNTYIAVNVSEVSCIDR